MPRIEPKYVRSDLPVGISGAWIVEKFRVTEPILPNAGEDPRPHWARSSPGIYTRLSDGSTVMMTDTHEEWWTQRKSVAEACRRGGRVLITGLGLGVVMESMFQTPGSRIEHVTVVEASAEVIELVAPHFKARYGERLAIDRASAFDWVPPDDVHFSVAWHDIWPNPYDPAIQAEMDQLIDRYADVCDWQGCWGRDGFEG